MLLGLRLVVPVLAAGCVCFACSSTPSLEFDVDASDASSDATLPSDGGAPGADASADGASPTDAAADAVACTLDGSSRLGTCDTCLGTRCCVQANDCFAVPACVALIYCVQDCVGDGGMVTPCRQTCRTRHPGGATTAAALAQCISGTCDGCF